MSVIRATGKRRHNWYGMGEWQECAHGCGAKRKRAGKMSWRFRWQDGHESDGTPPCVAAKAGA